ncbi:MAG: hypothetical protein DLM55_10935 [Acidimicrobiales bacterium]|nr:MAG: hypothetical protein DLM55_10935 [Acidimicrobiales bacterium]
MTTYEDEPAKEPAQAPVSKQPWRAVAQPVAPEELHRRERFGHGTDAYHRAAPQHSSPIHPRVQPQPALRYSRGRGWVGLASVVALAFWFVWLAYDLIELGSPGEPIRGLPFAAAAAAAVYWLTRLAGYLIRVTWDTGPRRSTLVPNMVTAVFIALCGVAFLSRTPFAVGPLWDELWGHLGL